MWFFKPIFSSTHMYAPTHPHTQTRHTYHLQRRHTNTHRAPRAFTERRPRVHTHTPGFHICPLSLPPPLNFYLSHSCQGRPAYRCGWVTTVTLSDVTSRWKKRVRLCLNNAEKRDETPCMSGRADVWCVCERWGGSDPPQRVSGLGCFLQQRWPNMVKVK